jgi:hypothetical protein
LIHRIEATANNRFYGGAQNWRPMLIGLDCFVRPRDLESKTCPYCGREFTPSRSHPLQVVCSSGDCQRRRRTDYHRRKLSKDPLYRALCKDSQETWKQRNPDYMKQYRARQRDARPHHARGRRSLPDSTADLKRLLSLVKNTLVENNPAVRIKRCDSGVWLITAKTDAVEKNTLAPTHVVIIQGLTLQSAGRRAKEQRSGNSAGLDV